VSVRPVGDDAPDMDADMDANADVDEAVWSIARVVAHILLRLRTWQLTAPAKPHK
jgi:hypothetical protein